MGRTTRWPLDLCLDVASIISVQSTGQKNSVAKPEVHMEGTYSSNGRDGILNRINILIPATSKICSILQVRRLSLKRSLDQGHRFEFSPVWLQAQSFHSCSLVVGGWWGGYLFLYCVGTWYCNLSGGTTMSQMPQKLLP